jgi:hypothetical protein
MMILGVECLGVDHVDLRVHEEAPAPAFSLDSTPREGPPKQVIPAPWCPWTFLSTGAVVCLYCFTIPIRLQGK